MIWTEAEALFELDDGLKLKLYLSLMIWTEAEALFELDDMG